MKYRIKDLPIDERPREKLKMKGSSALSDEELLAIILKCGTKEESVKDLSIRLMKNIGSLYNLNTITYQDLIKIKGIKEAKAITLLASIELGKRLNKTFNSDNIHISTAEDVFNLLKPEIKGLKQEKLFLISLDTRNQLIACDTVFIGTQNRSITHPREIFEYAIKRNAMKIILVHNHPSNDTSPSPQDKEFTASILEASDLMQIPLLDHIIIGENSYYSFLDNDFI